VPFRLRMGKPIINMERKHYEKYLETSKHAHARKNVAIKDGYQHNIVEKVKICSHRNC